MKKLLNGLLLLILLGALVFLGIKAKLIPNPLENQPQVTPTPQSTLVARPELRVAVAARPEKLLMSSLQRLLKAKNFQLELVEYNPDTVWLELAGGEIDLVITPLGEAVKAQGRFKPGRFLFFTGLSVGLDQLLASPDAKQPKNVAVQHRASTDFLARQMLPEATVVSAESLQEVESWLEGGAVEAALIDTSANSPALSQKYTILKKTSNSSPMPTVAVLSRQFAENAGAKEYDKRREVLFSALASWGGLVSYLDDQSELLRTTLKKEADQSGIDVDRLLAGYTYLTPGNGRSRLLQSHKLGHFQRTLDLLVLSEVDNLSAPDWDTVVNIPTAVDRGFENTGGSVSLTPPTPEPQVTPTRSVPPTTPTPAVTPTPEVTASPSQTPVANPPENRYQATNHALDRRSLPTSWPSPAQLPAKASESLASPLSSKRVLLLSKDKCQLYAWDKSKVDKELASAPTTQALSDGRQFFLGLENKIVALSNTGKEVWHLDVKGTPLGLPELTQDHLFYAINEGDRGRLICIDPVDGEILWENVLNSPPATGPVLGNGKVPLVIVSDQEGSLQAWDAQGGTWQWESKLKNPVYITPATGYGHLVVVEPQGKVRYFELAGGTEVWDADLGTALVAPPTITLQGVLVPAKDTYLYSLSKKKGGIEWKYRANHPLSEPTIVVDGQLLQSDEGGKVHLVNPRDGSSLGIETVTSGGWLSKPTISGKHWTVVDQNGDCWVYSRT